MRHFTWTFALSFLLLACSHADVKPINGIDLYYEIKGSGTPIVFLHGGYSDSDMWAVHKALLDSDYQIITIDSRGHGRSTDGNTPITYQLMADDTLKLLNALNISNAHFVGWSDGAVIAAQIAATQPQYINKLVMIGASFGADTFVPAFSAILNNEAIFKAFADTAFSIRYKKKNPDPNHWPVFRDKGYDMWQTPCYLDSLNIENCLEPLESIPSETLVLVGHNEIISKDHTEEIASTIPNAELITVHFAGHYLPEVRPFKTVAIIKEFLEN